MQNNYTDKRNMNNKGSRENKSLFYFEILKSANEIRFKYIG